MGNVDGRPTEGALDKALAVLGAFTPERGPIGVSDVARIAGVSKSTAFRILSTFVEWRYLEREGSAYAIGPRLSIQDSPTELAQDMKAVVREQLAQGKSEEEVTAYFVEKYGEWILLQPKAEGFNLTVYLLPVFSLVLGGGVVAMGIRRWTRNAPPASDEPLEPEY